MRTWPVASISVRATVRLAGTAVIVIYMARVAAGEPVPVAAGAILAHCVVMAVMSIGCHVPPGSRISGRASLLVPLDSLFGPSHGAVGVQPGIATSAPLTEEIPALVERDLDRAQPFQVGVGQRFTDVSALETVLLVRQITDAAHDVEVIHHAILAARGRVRTAVRVALCVMAGVGGAPGGRAVAGYDGQALEDAIRTG